MPSSRPQDRRLAALPVAAGGGGMLGLPAGLDGQDFYHLLAFDDFLDAGHDVFGLERLAIVFADMAVGGNTGFGPKVASELAALVVLDHNNPLALAENFEGLLGLERNQNSILEMVGRDAFLVESLGGLHQNAPGGAPAHQRYVRVGRPFEFQERHVLENRFHLAVAFVYHLLATDGVGINIADDDAVFIVLVGGGDEDVSGQTRNRSG